MAKKVVIETGKKEKYAVIFDERKDPLTGELHIKQKFFNSNDEADVFLEDLGLVKEDVGIITTLDKRDSQTTQIPFNQYAKEWFYDEHSHEVTPSTFKVRKVLLEKHIAPRTLEICTFMKLLQKKSLGYMLRKNLKVIQMAQSWVCRTF